MAVFTSVSPIKEAEFYECPRCKAARGFRCRTKSGRTTQPHVDREHLLRYLHRSSQCAGEHCPIHNPSDHHMREWRLVLRSDLLPPIYERLCPDRGIGHPDPDSAAWAQRAVAADTELKWQVERSDGEYVWVHGCDGCCRASS